MDRLWTPWRYQYITGAENSGRPKGVPAKLDRWPSSESEDMHCVFCNMIAAVDYAIHTGMDVETAEAAVYLVDRGAECFVCLNAYPYGTGHVLIVPYAHSNSLAALPEQTAHEMMQIMQRVERCLREVYKPDGFNFGMNLGEAAGAGIADHLHLHGLPRWSGDVNFMTVIGETRILPETLDVTWSKLRAAMQNPLHIKNSPSAVGSSTTPHNPGPS
jgi:ATP adenylyltransferase